MIITIFKQLETLTSVKDKENLLLQHKGNDELKELIEANLNPERLFQFNKLPDYVLHQSGKQNQHEEFKQLLTNLERRLITGNAAKEEVINFLSNVHAEDAGLYEAILLKKPIGVGASTVNKVWPGLIPDFKLMLAPNKLPNLTQVKYPVMIQPKLDGYRCIYREGKLYSRAGLSFGNINLSKYFHVLNNVGEYVLDGELFIANNAFNGLQKVLNNESAPLPNGLKLVVYDCVPLKDWINQDCPIPYKERLKLLRSLLNDRIASPKKVIDIASDEINDAAEAVEIYKKYLKSGYEGAMLKDINGRYQWKRTTIRSGEMLKVKPFKTEDLEIIDVYEGEGKFANMLGGIIVSGDNINPTSVGSGFSDDLREEIWRNKNYYVGKTAEVKYFEITEDKVLRFPIFQRIRDDK